MATHFLEKDVGTLSRWYGQETQAATNVPYVYLQRWSVEDPSAARIPLRTVVNREKFVINRDRPHGWLDVSERGIAALAAEGHDLKRSESLVRVSSFDRATNTLSVQQAEYNDQRRSNLILDFKVPDFPTLRDMMRTEYGRRLPPLSDDRLANTLGIALMVIVNENGRLAAYCVKRSKKGVAVFQEHLGLLSFWRGQVAIPR